MELHESKLNTVYYYGARYYDPKSSVWLGVDPKAEKAPSTSPYAYCSNNPIKYVDPDGKFKKFFGAVLYSIAHGGGKVSRDRTNGEYFVENRNKGGSVNEPGMLSGPEISHQRRYSWGGRSEPRAFPVQKASEQPTIGAQKDDKYYYSEKNYQARQDQAKFEQAKSDIINSDAVSFGSNETGLGAVQCLYEGLSTIPEAMAVEGLGLPVLAPKLYKIVDAATKINDLRQAASKMEEARKATNEKRAVDQ